MAKYCPNKNGPALYLECQECRDKRCQNTDTRKTFYCMIVGSRNFFNYEKLREISDMYLSEIMNAADIIIVSGGARGADSLAEQYAKERRSQFLVFKADWENLGRHAGMERNEQMHQFIAQYPYRGIIAFWDGSSRGTAHNFILAKKYKNPIRIVRYEDIEK
ncbi:MAG: DUF2493 domain-containing protein [Lachnospiraceae bacterium]|nr:DUF2493 domain-containing protein [Lachnospiraceae bacterium]